MRLITDPCRSLVQIDPWELRSPAQLVREVAQRVPLAEGAAYAVLVADPSGEQSISAIEDLGCAYLDNDDVRRMEERVDELDQTWAHGRATLPSDHQVVTFLVRSGPCVWTSNETAWAVAWRYGYKPLSGGDFVLVTEFGWWHLMTNHADHEPAMTPIPRSPSA